MREENRREKEKEINWMGDRREKDWENVTT